MNNSKKRTKAEILVEMYKKFDTDGNGTIDIEEFVHSIHEMEIKASEAEIKLLFGFFDKDNSGDIDYNEFVALVLSGQAPSAADPKNVANMGDLQDIKRRMHESTKQRRCERIKVKIKAAY